MKNALLVTLLFISITLLADGVLPAGAGTSGDPYQIADLDNLLWVSTTGGSWDNHIIQTADINAADTQTWNGGTGFSPIGNSSNNFEGNYNGQGYVIDSLYINRPSTQYIGLFGRCDDASISYLGLTNAEVTGNKYVGILGGYSTDDTVTSYCFSSGNVTATEENSYVGGLIGNNTWDSVIQYCYSISSITGNKYVGGLVGGNGWDGIIRNCFSQSSVSGNEYVAGLIGITSWRTVVQNSYSTGAVSGSGSYGIKGFIGSKASDATVSNCFWDTETSGQSSSAGGSGRTTIQMQTMSTFTDAGWDFIEETTNGTNDYWGINGADNGLYPFLGWQGFANNMYAPSGTGTEVDPILVEHLGHLAWISNDNSYWDYYIIQTADIDASASAIWNGGAGFIPIGVDSSNPFSGNYDGQGFVIDELFINKASGRTGLFGYTDNATISNLGVTNVDISASSQTAALVGFNTFSTITNCYTSGNVTGDWTTAGLVGRNENSTITKCHSSVNVDAGGDHNGGLVGTNMNSIMENCYATGNVVGYEEDLGGLVGENKNNSIINNCYSTGNVSGGTAHVGGLVGRILSDATVTNSFWNTETSGQAASAGGTGKTTTEMKTQSTFTDAGWDFAGETTNGTDDYWNIFDYYHNGYPILEWEVFLPWVTTAAAATQITHNSASAGGEVANEGNSSVTARGVCYNTAGNPNIADSYTTDGTGAGTFTSALTGLNFSTTYYYRAYATNTEGTFYGSEYSFLTTPAGTGVSGDPFQISTLTELQWINEHSSYWNSHYIQTADIDASDTQNWNSGAGFDPIGVDYDNPFNGSYNGQGHIISGLYINRSTTPYVGLFAAKYDSPVTNLGLVDVDITGQYYVGALVGLMGYGSSVSGCYSTGTITGRYAGGLIGYSEFSISNSYSRCTVSGDSNIGGLVGHLYGTITDSYSSGSVSGNSNVGGLVGYSSSNATASNSFWDMQTSGQSTSARGIGKTTAEMQTKSTFINAGWDFISESGNGTDETWVLFANDYPVHWLAYGPVQLITAVEDVPGDQGRNINVSWDKCGLDDMNSLHPIVGYNLWIEYPNDTRNAVISNNINKVIKISEQSGLTSQKKTSLNNEPEILYERDGETWVLAASLYAMQWDTYTVFTQTYRDSSTVEDNPSTFFVSAHTTAPSVYFSSDVVSGYSLDNIAPNAAANVTLALGTVRRNSTASRDIRAERKTECIRNNRNNTITLSWDEVTEGSYQGNSYPEQNGIWYKIYSSNVPTFVCDENTYLTTTENTIYEIDITGAEKMFFKIIVSDLE